MAKLRPVRTRYRLGCIARFALVGLAVGIIVALLLGVLRILYDTPTLTWMGLAALLVGPLAGAVAGVFRGIDWRQAAMAVDRRYNLKDRTLTALQTDEAKLTPAQQITVDGALADFERVRAAEVVPLQLPPHLLRWGGMLATAVLLLTFPLGIFAHATPQPKPIEQAEVTAPVAPSLETLQRSLESASQVEEPSPLGQNATVRRYLDARSPDGKERIKKLHIYRMSTD